MGPRLVVLVAGLSLALGCQDQVGVGGVGPVKAGPPRAAKPAPTPCELDALHSLAVRLETLALAERTAEVWPGIEAACPAPPESVRFFFRAKLGQPEGPRMAGPDAQLRRLQRRACPNWAKVAVEINNATPAERAALAFARCDFARLGVVAPEQVAGTSTGLVSFAAHAWLEEQGLEADDAAVLGAALYALEQSD